MWWGGGGGLAASSAALLLPPLQCAPAQPSALSTAHLCPRNLYLSACLQIRDKYQLQLPPYPGVSQCVRIGGAARSPAAGPASVAEMRITYGVAGQTLDEAEVGAAWHRQEGVSCACRRLPGDTSSCSPLNPLQGNHLPLPTTTIPRNALRPADGGSRPLGPV